MRGRIIGLVVLVVIIVGALVYQFVLRDGAGEGGFRRPAEATVRGFIGSEKTGFLEDEEIRRILRARYGLTVDYSKAGSIEMIRMDEAADMDFLWPSSQVALELYKLTRPGEAVKSEVIFNSPIVFYSWDLVVNELVGAGIARQESGDHYTVPTDELVNLVLSDTDWAAIGLEELYGKVRIISTDPGKSNSGNMFAGLVANVLHGDVVDREALGEVLDQVKGIFARQGYMAYSTGILFENYQNQGVGSFPLIVGYENQIVEFSLDHPEIWPRLRDRMRILYPVPTVWSGHPLIALTDNGRRLLDALADEEIQQLAWERHGFRTGLVGVQNDPEVLNIVGIPAEVTKVMPMPAPRVMETLTEAVSGAAASE